MTDTTSIDPDADLAAVLARHPEVKATISSRPEGVVISMITVVPERQREGLAGAFLRDLTEWADRHGKQLAGTPERLGKGASTATLRRWYARHGFVRNRGRTRDAFTESMVRGPRPPERLAGRPPAEREESAGAQRARPAARSPEPVPAIPGQLELSDGPGLEI